MRKSYKAAKELLTEHRKMLDKIADALLENEQLDAQQLKVLLNGATGT